MSALGQKRTFRSARAMSALPQKQTLELSRVMSALRQKRTFGAATADALFDHLVGQQLHGVRERQAKCFRSSKIDDQFKLSRLDHR